jgi:nucleoside-diphosphate-sugar epimerase
VIGAKNTLELAADLGVPKILHTSTVGVFGNTHGKIVDETYRAPKAAMRSEYELTKWTAHYEVAEPLQKQGAPLIILQPGGVTGAGDPAQHALIFKMFLNRIPIMLGASSGLTLAHVDDIAEGHRLALEKGLPGEAYILAGDPLTYRQVFEVCEEITGIRGTRLWAPGWVAGFSSVLVGVLEKLGLRPNPSAEMLATLDDYTFWAVADKAKGELGWLPRTTEETLKDVLTDLQKK